MITRRNQILRRSTFVQLEGYSTRLIVVEVPIGPWYFFVMLSIGGVEQNPHASKQSHYDDVGEMEPKYFKLFADTRVSD